MSINAAIGETVTVRIIDRWGGYAAMKSMRNGDSADVTPPLVLIYLQERWYIGNYVYCVNRGGRWNSYHDDGARANGGTVAVYDPAAYCTEIPAPPWASPAPAPALSREELAVRIADWYITCDCPYSLSEVVGEYARRFGGGK